MNAQPRNSNGPARGHSRRGARLDGAAAAARKKTEDALEEKAAETALNHSSSWPRACSSAGAIATTLTSL